MVDSCPESNEADREVSCSEYTPLVRLKLAMARRSKIGGNGCHPGWRDHGLNVCMNLVHFIFSDNLVAIGLYGTSRSLFWLSESLQVQ
jgi:hypothetical protein